MALGDLYRAPPVALGALGWQCVIAVIACLLVGREQGDACMLLRTTLRAAALLGVLVLAPTACGYARRATSTVLRWRASSTVSRCPSAAHGHACVTTIHGREYDLSTFVDSHPGGPTAILLAHGTDATALFESYHLSQLPAAILARYELGSSGTNHSSDKVGCDRTTSPSTVVGWRAPRGRATDPFYDVLRARVAEVFEARGRGTKATYARLGYYAVTLALWSALLGAFLVGSWTALPFYTLAAWHVAGIGHDAAHFEVSSEPLVNSVMACCIGTISNPLQWYYQHTVGHHSHTNDPELDPDLHHYAPFLRVHERKQRHDWHQWQDRFVWAFMLLFTFGQALWQPIIQSQLPGEQWVVNGTTPVLMQGHVRRAVLSVGMLIIYLAAHIGVPLLCHHPVRALFFFGCYIGGTGLLFGLSSAINHMTPASIAVEPTPKADGAAASGRGPLAMAEPSPARLLQQHSWAARQAVASNNFCLSSSLAFWLSNALNYQVEHHLFPGINHEHLPTISPIVRATCNEFGVPYHSFDSWVAIAGEFRSHLRSLGQAPPREALKTE